MEAVRFVQWGGTLIFGIGFPSFTSREEYKTLFKAFGLPWESGEYFRGEFEFNGTVEHLGSVALSPKYSQKALHLRNVERRDAVYLPSASSPTADLTQTPAAFRDNHPGKIGYLGDVNMEEETHQVLLAMCGLSN
jgi:hypothetical protein